MHPMLQNFNMCNASTLYIQSLHSNQIWMSSFIRSRDIAWAPKCRNESRDSDHAHLGDSQHDKANTSHGQVVYEIWSLQL